jgi:hypothetical protein
LAVYAPGCIKGHTAGQRNFLLQSDAQALPFSSLPILYGDIYEGIHPVGKEALFKITQCLKYLYNFVFIDKRIGLIIFPRDVKAS